MLELQQITKTYDGVAVVAGVDLIAPEGKTVGLLGPSGCGKSTLLRVANGLIRADRGRVQFDGVTLTAENARDMRLRMGYVIQDGGLFPHLTARDNVTLMARQLHRPAAEIRSNISQLIDLTRFPSKALDRYPAQLSGGQRQRVALMRALMLDPEVLLLDEPLGALDPLVRYELQTDLKAIFQSLCKTVVLVTHDLSEAGFFADEIVLMRQGRIEQRGSIDNLLNTPATPFVEQFITAQRGLFGTNVSTAPLH
jgi:osmoprotectant transport system ATP-binding protein